MKLCWCSPNGFIAPTNGYWNRRTGMSPAGLAHVLKSDGFTFKWDNQSSHRLPYLCRILSYLRRTLPYLCRILSYLRRTLPYLCRCRILPYLCRILSYLCRTLPYLCRTLPYLCRILSYLCRCRILPYLCRTLPYLCRTLPYLCRMDMFFQYASACCVAISCVV